ncbi:Fis family transcriptional regulator [Stenomitos frigidus ULC18]|uniref:Fis family transcriptional regulator n=2 Tax=Stenomitos TaxID=1844270 RepID=A0A2T1E706_9CYAN|nr:Fis family transcriptional regulator [Stenomitos frigidus ULC18]
MNGQNSSSSSSNLIQRDRFELLSAYLDGEVTAAERKQVDGWLASDPTVQRLHSRLLKLRHGLQNMPVPASSQATEQTVSEVFTRLERKPKLSLIWGGAAIAALFVGALVSNLLPGSQTSMPQIAKGSQQPAIESPQTNVNEVLLVALDKPLVEIPKTPVVVPNSTFKNATTPAPETTAR